MLKQLKKIIFCALFPNYIAVKCYPAKFTRDGETSYRFNFLLMYSQTRRKFSIKVEGETDYKIHQTYSYVLKQLSTANILLSQNTSLPVIIEALNAEDLKNDIKVI